MMTAASAQPARATASTPSCTFNGSPLPVAFNVSPGSQVQVSCTGLPILHPYLFVETSLLIGIDPAAAPLFSGQILSLSGLNALLNALPELNLLTSSIQFSGLDGSLNYTYTVPSSQPLDPNATCPPDTTQFNSGLIGCAVAMIDLTSFKPAAGSFVTAYAGGSLLPPNPTLALSKAAGKPGKTITVSDAPGATTYWWLATLTSLSAILGGGSAATPTVTVTLTHGKHTVTATSNIQTTPASYQNGVFTPPALSGSFVVPSGLPVGTATLTVSASASILGQLNPSVSVSVPFKIKPVL